MQLQPNTLFHNHYNLIRLIGRGGFSEVWLAKDKYTELDLALKIYAPNGGLDDNGIQAFSGEIRRVYNLNHPSLLKAQHFDVCDGMPYLVMPYCANGSVTKQVGKMTEPEVWHLLHDVAAGLAYLHENNIVHQDIKPDNIMQDTNGHYLITDFGISARTRATLTKTQSASNLGSGTAAYMAPERFSTNPLPTFASDVWALGATVYELIVGTVPFGDGSLPGGLLQKNGAEIPDISTDSTPTISEKLASVIRQMLSVNPWDRPTAKTLMELATEMIKNKEPSRPTILKVEEPSQIKIAPSKIEIENKSNKNIKKFDIRPFVFYSLVIFLFFVVVFLVAYFCNPPKSQSKEDIAPSYTIALSDTNLVIPYNGKSVDVNVISKSSTWDFANTHTWCTVTKKMNSFRLTIYENTKNTKRTANIKFYAEGDSVILNIIQEASPHKFFTINGVSFTMKYIQGGTFNMGATSEQDNNADENEHPMHSVTVNDYYIGETEVTQKLWQAVMHTNPSHNKEWNNDPLTVIYGCYPPVECISYNDCQKFIHKLNKLTGQHFRLPTEAEWEFAARGGNKSQCYKYAGSNFINDVAWCDERFPNGITHPVKKKKANELGLYDMSGNVNEWCKDWYGIYSIHPQTNPKGPSSGEYRVYRGGGYHNNAEHCRVSAREYATPSNSYDHIGLRLALSL